MKYLYIIVILVISGLTRSFTGFQRPDLLSYVDTNGVVKPVRTESEWEIKRLQILDSMQAVMGPLPDRHHLPPLNIEYTDSIETDHYVRYTIRFTAAAGELLPAYLYVPIQRGVEKRLPAMLALHPTGALGKKIVDGQSALPNRGYAKELAKRGYVVIAPDYPGFGELSDYNFKADRYVSATMKGIFDNMRCVDLLQERADVDPERIGVIGHSLGGHNAIFAGAFDTRLKVVISSCGWTLLADYFNGDTVAAEKQGGKLWPWAQEKYMPLVRSKYHLDPDKIPFDFDEVIAAIAPRAFFSNSPLYDANFNADGVRKGMEGIAKVYQLLGAEKKWQVHYPSSKHDFPPQVRGKAYQFMDNVFQFKPGKATPYSYLDNPTYLKRLGQFEVPEKTITIAMLGNSLTQRGDWKEILKREDVVNRGIGSDITLGFINRLNSVFNCHPKICIIEGGANDLVHDISDEAIVGNLAILIDTLRQKNIIPVLNTVTVATDAYRYLDPKLFNGKIAHLNKAIKKLAVKKNVQLIDINPLVSDGQYRFKKYAVADGIHYTDIAYDIWGQKIAEILQKHKMGFKAE